MKDAALLSQIGRLFLLESNGQSASAEGMQAYHDESLCGALINELADPARLFHILTYNGQPAGYSRIIFQQPVAQVPQMSIP